jgi:hypothetical protein
VFYKKIDTLVTKWLVLSYGGELEINTADGSKIHYKGVAYQGSPCSVFWGGWVDEYVKHESITIMTETAQLASEANYNIHECVQNSCDILLAMVDKIYSNMVDIDSRLRGSGFRPASPRTVSSEICSMHSFITSQSKIIVDQYSAKNKHLLDTKFNTPIIEAKPGFCGISINLIELKKRYWSEFSLYLKTQGTFKERYIRLKALIASHINTKQ